MLYNHTNSNNLLDEGSLLLLKVDKTRATRTNPNDWISQIISTGSINDDDNVDNVDNVDVVIPLGKILEVFGPVSKPLYTVRLLLWNHNSSTTATTTTATATAGNNDDRKSQQVSNKSEIECKDTTVGSQVSEQPHDEDYEDDDDHTSSNSKVVVRPTKDMKPMTSTDPWSEDGPLTKWIRSNPSLEVYYATNQVKFVDTQRVAQNSKKGCGKFV